MSTSAPLKVIGDKTYAFGTLPATVAIDVQVIIARALGDGLLSLIMAKDTSPEEQAQAMKLASAALTSSLKASDVKELIGKVFSCVTVGDGVSAAVPVNVDAHFTGRPRRLWEVLIEALKVNFSDFFPNAGSGSTAATPTPGSNQ